MDSIIFGMLKKLNKKVDAIGNIPDEKIIEAVNTYLDENPVAPGATSEQAKQIQDNTNKIGELKDDLSQLSEEMENIAVGISAAAKNLLITILQNGVYGNDQSDNINALKNNLFEDSDANNIIVTQNGNTLTISGYMATAIQQSGNVLMVS